MVETEISYKYKNELWQKQNYHINTKMNYGRTRNIIQIQTRIMVETEISQNTKTNYGRNRNIIEYKNELWQNQKYHDKYKHEFNSVSTIIHFCIL